MGGGAVPPMIAGVASLIERISGSADWSTEARAILAELGQLTGADRAYLFRLHEHGGFGLAQTCLADWARDGLAPLTGDRRNTDENLRDADPLFMSWTERRRRGEVIRGHTRDLTGYLRADFEHQRILSFLSVPIMVAGAWWGHIGLDSCFSEREWTEEEVAALRLVAASVALAVARSSSGYSRSEAVRAAIVATSLDAIVTADEAGRIVEFNPAAEAMFGLSRGEAVGLPLWDVIVPERLRADYAGTVGRRLSVDGSGPFGQRVEMPGRRQSGAEFPAEMTFSEVQVAGRRLFTAFIRDITERKAAAAALERLAYADAATGLPNRAGLTRAMASMGGASMGGASTGGAPMGGEAALCVLAVRFIDFDAIVAGLGQDFAESLAVEAARRCAGALLDGAVLARIAPNCLAVALPCGMTDPGMMADALRGCLARPFHLANRSIKLRVGLGMEVAPWHEQILDDAVMASLQAAADAVVVFDAALRASRVNRLTLESDLRTAMEVAFNVETERNVRRPGGLWVAYQPIVRLADGGLAGFEALVRWDHASRGILSPAEFIPIAEETGLIFALGRWVLEEATRQAALWTRFGLPLFVSVNVSPRQFADPDLPLALTEAITRAGLPKGALKLEITESVVAGNEEEAVAILKDVRCLGASVAIDDFGTGYSSLSYLHRLPIDVLKIDRSFVTGMRSAGNTRQIVRSVLDLSRCLGIDTVAEGVETAEDAETLREYGCRYGQGWLYGQPLLPEDATRLIGAEQARGV
ncbi:EAL domain-containing protein [Azospirillum sp. SYSU D00513]|uniref:putative bifunctional diguanylate cyclase/phosphodiesterase n=1 Tax=Azospirillum sp. SYSU D00513 TaxID=2812561 RepID=UPI001A9735E6|nr:EAL domain-containing protein [Azospirillum sp. SYSU D00513]